MKINFNGNNSGKTKLIWLGLCLPRFWALHQQAAQHFHNRFIRKQSDSFLSHPEHTIWLSRHRTFRTQCLHMGFFSFWKQYRNYIQKSTWKRRGFFLSEKLHPKSASKWRENSSKSGLHRIHKISTSNRRQFHVECSLGRLLYVEIWRFSES